jgi:predicted acyltransferase
MEPPARLLSIDLVRGGDVWLMLFVNEMAGVRGTPPFLLHVPPAADGMTITDVVFPAFLFVTGMAIPLPLGGRLRRGAAASSVWRHVLVRSAALIVMGVLMVNSDHARPDGLLPPPLWNVLVTLAIALVWMTPEDARRRRAWRGAGLVLLAVLVLLYRADGLSGPIQVRPYWWGILGLIGWAYLTGAAAYLLGGDRPAILVGVVALLYLVSLADEADAIFALVLLRPVMWVGRVLGSHGALVLSGAVLTVALLRHRATQQRPARFIPQAAGYGAALAAAGLLLHSLHALHPAFWINKTRATAAWCLLAGAATVAAWTVAYALADVRGWRRWPRGITTAGENALTIYLLAPFLLSVFALLGGALGTNPYHTLGGSLGAGLLRSIAFAWVVVRLSGWLATRGLRVRV